MFDCRSEELDSAEAGCNAVAPAAFHMACSDTGSNMGFLDRAMTTLDRQLSYRQQRRRPVSDPMTYRPWRSTPFALAACGVIALIPGCSPVEPNATPRPALSPGPLDGIEAPSRKCFPAGPVQSITFGIAKLENKTKSPMRIESVSSDSVVNAMVQGFLLVPNYQNDDRHNGYGISDGFPPPRKEADEIGVDLANATDPTRAAIPAATESELIIGMRREEPNTAATAEVAGITIRYEVEGQTYQTTIPGRYQFPPLGENCS